MKLTYTLEYCLLPLINEKRPNPTSGGTSKLLFISIVVLLIEQTRFLFVYPIPDTAMWFGDESWMMLLGRGLIKTGSARFPEALGSTLFHSTGLIVGSLWGYALLYGAPGYWWGHSVMFGHAFTLVEIGRIVTLLVSLVTLYYTYHIARQLDIAKTYAIACVLLITTCDAFLFSTHSARSDGLTGLGVLVLLSMCLRAIEHQVRNKVLRPGWWFSFGLIATGLLSFSQHHMTTAALFCVYAAWKLGALKHWRQFAAMIAGATVIVGALLAIYFSSMGDISMYGSHRSLQYQNIVGSLPVFHPFSVAVQWINTYLRIRQFMMEAWPVGLLLAVGVLYWMLIARPRPRIRIAQPKVAFFLVATFWLVMSCMLFEGPAVFYLIHLLPWLAIAAVLLAERAVRRFINGKARRVVIIVASLFVVCAITNAFYHAEMFGNVGATLTQAHSAAVSELLAKTYTLGKKPLIATAQQGVNYVDRDTNVRLMTYHFLLFGLENVSPIEVIDSEHVDYLLTYTGRPDDAMQSAADSYGTLVATSIGHYTDLYRDYFAPNWTHLDTLRLYRWQRSSRVAIPIERNAFRFQRLP
ncbi:MAG: hypothetical protein ABI444_07890 [Candidatus Kapaibacterium sp.]